MKKNNISIKFIGTCFDISSEGKGVVKYDSIVGFVDNILIGETAEIEITYKKKDKFNPCT
jgi:tRNA/tmRNA/rRNA uracil-C5-methylase (TrmA/RlmC/RlmD family)